MSHLIEYSIGRYRIRINFWLLILFLLMLSYTLSKGASVRKRNSIEDSLIEIQRVFGGKVDPELAERAKRRDQEMLLTQNLQARVQEGELGEKTRIVVTEKRISLALGEGILFDSGGAKLKPSEAPS